ncbi:MAG TPA: SGNH/GDSL hydrolase family protein [Rhizomicrobium sp.]|nr:SGNH/GDSL hydrolase family protein [Rhizomicrobium sp.]
MIIRQFILATALVLGSVAGVQSAPPKESWIGAWGFVPTPLPPGAAPAPAATASSAIPLGASLPAQPAPAAPSPLLIDNPGNLPVMAAESDPANVTIRQLVRVAVAGKRLRLRLSNEAGSEALVLGAVHVGAAGPDGTVLPGTDHVVTFDGHGGVAIPASAPLLSDPVAMNVEALQKLVISIHIPGPFPRTGHSLYQYVAGQPGDHTAAGTLPNVRIMRLPAVVTQLDVDPVSANAVVVTLGDSITEGAASTNNAFRGWPDRLAERLAAAHSKWSVVNTGIGGNRLLRYGTGPSALARLDRDVFSVSGIKAIILLEGINDIGRGFYPPTEPVTAEALIAADKQIIARAHARGILVYGATLTPYKGAHYFMPEGEQVREAVNLWIKTSGAFDGVVDFAPSVADKSDPTTFDTNYNLSDKLHPNDAGYQAMANAIDLGLLK